MKRFSFVELITGLLAVIGLLLAGSDAGEPVWPWNVLAGAVLLAVAGLLAAFSRPAPRR